MYLWCLLGIPLFNPGIGTRDNPKDITGTDTEVKIKPETVIIYTVIRNGVQKFPSAFVSTWVCCKTDIFKIMLCFSSLKN